MMRLIEGGMRMPSVPPRRASRGTGAHCSGTCRITGTATVETVAAVATLDPAVAAKAMLAPMLACISPPGSHDSQRPIAPYMRSVEPGAQHDLTH